MLNEFKNAFQRQNNAHVQLIIINVIVFLIIAIVSWIGEISSSSWVSDIFYDQFTIPPKFHEFSIRPWTLITYMFAHSKTDYLHIIVNMLVFYWFGKLFIEYLGSDKLVALYLLGGLAGGIAYLIIFNTVPFYIERAGLGMVGASAAVYAIVVAAATLIPDYTFFLLLIGPVRIKYIAGFYVIISFLGTTQANAGGNIAHLGGALMGFIYIKQLQNGVNLGGWITAMTDWFRGVFSSKPKVKVTYRKSEPYTKNYSKSSKASQEEIDAILDKISDRGYESLTKEEKEKLFNASKK